MEESKVLDVNSAANIDFIKQQLGNSSDLSIKQFKFSNILKNVTFSIIFLSSLVDKSKVDEMPAELIELSDSMNNGDHITVESCFSTLRFSPLCGCEVSEGSDYETLFNQLVFGNTIILIDGLNKYLIYKTYGPEGRAIEEPTSQTVIRGPKEGFTEKIEVNISQIRRRIKDKALRIEKLNLGTVTKTDVALIYIDKIARVEIVNEVRARINQIKIDGVLESRYIQELIKDDPYSLFPTIYDTERPDAVASSLLEGKVAILVDGTPFVLTAPALFMEFFISSEDYYHHFSIATLFRIIRLIAFFLTILVPAVYIALTTFNQELIPTPLLLSIAAQREGVPFPAFFEAILMELTFEVLREAGIRMPRAIGPAISIVGALVLGQAAVQAGFVSAIMVIVVSITAISNFCVPNTSMSNGLRIIRFAFMLLAASVGIYGIFIGLTAMVLHLCKLKSIGVPYMSPNSPKLANKNEDNVVRTPLWKRKRRPGLISSSNVPRTNMNGPVKPGSINDREMK